MSLIDLNSVISNFIWILAIAWLLSVISMARWTAQQRGRKLSEQLNQPSEQLRLMVGGLILCLGLGLVVDSLWLMILWFLLGAIFIFLIILSVHQQIN